MIALSPPARVSVIVPTKNRSTLLREALASVRALEGPGLDIELIVADNGSTDDTAAVAAEFGARLVQALTPGAAAARNAGMRAATGEYLAFLDDDDVYTRDHLRPQIAFLREHPGFDAAVGQTMMVDAALAPIVGPWPPELPGDGDVFASFLAEYPQVGATVARASVRETVGELDEALYGDEDWDWHLRLALAHRVGFVPTVSVLFRQRPSGHSNEDDLLWTRLKFFRRVFLRNARRAGNRRPSLVGLTRIYVRLSGRYYRYFLESASRHGAMHDRAATRACLRRAFVASPTHALRGLIREREFRSALWMALPRPFATRRPEIERPA